MTRFDRSNESIASPRHGFNESGIAGRVAQNFANPVYAFFQRELVIHKSVVGPELPAQVIASNQFTGPFQQSLQDKKRLRPKLLPEARSAYFALVEVHLEDSKADYVTSLDDPGTHR